MRKILLYLQYPRLIFADILYWKSKNIFLGGKNIKQTIDADIEKYIPQKIKNEKKE